MLINNEIKDIIKVIRSSENKVILLKGTTQEINSQEGGFLNFLRPLMTTALPLMKILFSTIRSNASSISSRCSYSKENFWIRNNKIDIFKERLQRYNIP